MRWPSGRRIAAALLAALVPAAGAVALIIAEPQPVRALRDLIFDNYQRLAPRPYDPATPVRVVAIDEESLARIGQWPWPRETLAKLVERLGEAGAAAIALDIILSEPERQSGPSENGGGDAALAATLERHPVVLAQALGDNASPPAIKAAMPALGNDPDPLLRHFAGATVPLAAFVAAAQGVGAINWTPDRDLIVRHVPIVFESGGRRVPTLAIEALRVAFGASTILLKAVNSNQEMASGDSLGIVAVKIQADEAPPIATGKDGGLLIHYAGTQPQRRISAWRVLDASADLGAVKGGIVFVGATAAALGDVRATPLEPGVAGVDIHAEFVEHVLAGDRLTRPDYAPGMEAVAAVVGCIAIAFIAVFWRPLAAAATLLVLVVAIAAASWLAFSHAALLVDPMVPTLAIATTFGSATVGALRRSDRDKRRIREAFGRYLSPAIVEVLAEDPSRLKLGGEIRPITVLFSDVRGFTARSEELSAEDVLRFLNAVHAPMAEEVLKSGGTLDKFIGDGLMAFWNAPADTPDHVRAGLRCALAMQAALGPIDQALAEEDDKAGRAHRRLAMGVGIHTGLACVGNVGSLRRFDYSAIGDTVNTAARIEQTSKTYGVPIIVSEEVTRAAPDFLYLHVDEVRLRGRQHSSGLYALWSEAAQVTDEFREFRVLHDLAVSAYLNGGPDAELRIGICERHPLGARLAGLYQFYRDRLAAGRVAVSAVMPA